MHLGAYGQEGLLISVESSVRKDYLWEWDGEGGHEAFREGLSPLFC